MRFFRCNVNFYNNQRIPNPPKASLWMGGGGGCNVIRNLIIEMTANLKWDKISDNIIPNMIYFEQKRAPKMSLRLREFRNSQKHTLHQREPRLLKSLLNICM